MTFRSDVPPPPGKIDGRHLYRRVLAETARHHISLINPQTRRDWEQRWTQAFDGRNSTAEEVDNACRAALKSLNQRFDYYFDAEMTAAHHARRDPSYVGVGLQVGLSSGSSVSNANPLRVINTPPPGTPAHQAGITQGDVILAIDGKSLAGLDLQDATALLSGREGQPLRLQVSRPGSGIILNAAMTRKRLRWPTVVTRELKAGISYIQVAHFDSRFLPSEFGDALYQAGSGNAVILDLRNNPGGLTDNAYALCDMLLESGLIVDLQQREGDRCKEYRRITQPWFRLIIEDSRDGRQKLLRVEPRIPVALRCDVVVVVLVNEHSYSSAEIVAGVLQSNGRALVVGTPTAGKGVGLQMVHLPYGREVWLTNFLFLPGGMNVNLCGVIPDREVSQPNLSTAGSLESDLQLQAALQAAQELIAGSNAIKEKKRLLAETRIRHSQSSER